MKKRKEAESDFGKGLAYCLGLFLCHSQQKDAFRVHLVDWFNRASDHLYELQVNAAPEKLRARLHSLREKVMRWGHDFQEPRPTHDDLDWAVQEAKDLLRLLDKENGIPTQQGKWE